MDIASSIQSVIEEIVLKLAESIAKDFGAKNLCMSGGVALNCVTNGKILKKKIFEKIWIQPAAGDAGGALGAALALWREELKKERISCPKDKMQGSYLGPSFNDSEIEKSLNILGAKYTKLSEEELLVATAKDLLTQFHMDIASSIQSVTEDIIL
jgi:carbamoyltransferase